MADLRLFFSSSQLQSFPTTYQDINQMCFVKLIFIVVLLMPLSGCGYIYEMLWHHNETAAKIQYEKNYTENLTKETALLVQQLAKHRGESLYSYEPKITVPIQIKLPADDPELTFLLSNPDILPKLGFTQPRRFSESDNLREIFATWRFHTNDNSLIASAIETGNYGLKVSIEKVKDSIVFREGTNRGDWVFYLPEQPDCKWLSFIQSAYCAKSLHSWLAASIVGAKSNWERLDFGKQEITEEMKSLSESNLEEAIAKLVEFQPSIWNMPAKLTDTEFTVPYPEWHDVLKELGKSKPPPILNAKQTYRPIYGYSAYAAFIYLWKGDSFQRIRLNPKDYLSAVVVLSEPYGRERILQAKLNGRIVYIDNRERVAFYSFIEWVQWAIAKENVYKWKLFPRMSPNSASYPIG